MYFVLLLSNNNTVVELKLKKELCRFQVFLEEKIRGQSVTIVMTESTIAAPNWERNSNSSGAITNREFERSKDEVIEAVYFFNCIELPSKKF